HGLLYLILTIPSCHAYVASIVTICLSLSVLFFFTPTAPPDIYTLSLHDALPISQENLFGSPPVLFQGFIFPGKYRHTCRLFCGAITDHNCGSGFILGGENIA